MTDQEAYSILAAIVTHYNPFSDESAAICKAMDVLGQQNYRDVVSPTKINRVQELLNETYFKGFMDGKEEGYRRRYEPD